MSERNFGETSPARKHFSVDFYKPAGVHILSDGSVMPVGLRDPKFIHTTVFPFTNSETGEEWAAVVRSDRADLKRFIDEIGLIRIESPDLTDESLKVFLERNTESFLRLSPRPSVEYGLTTNGIYLNCNELSCRHNENSQCTTSKRLINDDSLESQWCMTLELKQILNQVQDDKESV